MYERYVLTHKKEIAHLPVVTSIFLFVVIGAFLQVLWGQNFTFLPPQSLALYFCIRSIQSTATLPTSLVVDPLFY